MTSLQKAGLLISGLFLIAPIAVSASVYNCYPQWCTGPAQLVSVLPASGPAPLTVVAAVKPRYLHGAGGQDRVLVDSWIEWGDGATTNITSELLPGGKSADIVYISHIFAAPGTHNVKLFELDFVNPPGEVVGTATVTVGTQAPPPPPPASAPLVVLLVNPASISAGGSASVIWASSNAKSCTGTNFTATGVAGYVSVNPAETTTYSITCTGDGGSATQSATLTVTAPPPPPPVNFSASPQSGTAPLTVGFTGNTNRINSVIDFGDGTSRPVTNFAEPPTGTGAYPMNAPFAEKYTYQAAGTYTAKLKDMNGTCVGTPCDGNVVGTVTITVTGGTSNPDKFSGTPTSGSAPLLVQFSGRSLPEGAYTLNFGDGQRATLNNLICTQMSGGNTCAFSFSHMYASNGTYTAALSRSLCPNGPSGCEAPDQQIGTIAITVGTTGGGSCLVLENELGQGDTDDDTNGEVSKLQAFLAKDPAIYPEGKVTGFFGALTAQAVKRYQKAHGIPETGYVGPKTRLALACKEVPPSTAISVTVSPASVQQGATTTIAWATTRAPENTAVSLRLLDQNGRRRGLIADTLATTSTYSWRIPYLSGDPTDIIEGIANCSGSACSGTLPAGTYKIQAALYSPANAFTEEMPAKVIASSTPVTITVTAKTAAANDPVANLAAAAAALANVLKTLQGR